MRPRVFLPDLPDRLGDPRGEIIIGCLEGEMVNDNGGRCMVARTRGTAFRVTFRWGCLGFHGLLPPGDPGRSMKPYPIRGFLNT